MEVPNLLHFALNIRICGTVVKYLGVFTLTLTHHLTSLFLILLVLLLIPRTCIFKLQFFKTECVSVLLLQLQELFSLFFVGQLFVKSSKQDDLFSRFQGEEVTQ